jgi:hypothetical protein
MKLNTYNMASELTTAITEEKKCAVYLLPLIQLSKFSFGVSNFVNCYINANGTVLTVEVIDLQLSTPFNTHPEYLNERENESGHGFIWFSLPDRWYRDFERFRKGKYSEFSGPAKHMIREYSQLTCKEFDPETGQNFTSAFLLALDKDPLLREHWERDLGVYLAEDSELLSPPTEADFKEVEVK